MRWLDDWFSLITANTFQVLASVAVKTFCHTSFCVYQIGICKYIRLWLSVCGFYCWHSHCLASKFFCLAKFSPIVMMISLICSGMPYLSWNKPPAVVVLVQYHLPLMCDVCVDADWLEMQATYTSPTLRWQTTVPVCTTSALCRIPNCVV